MTTKPEQQDLESIPESISGSLQDAPPDSAEAENGPPVDPRKLPDDGLGQGPETRDRQVPQAGPEDDGWEV